MMNKENMIEYKRKYEWYRHHAWAGLGLLSVFLAIRYFVFLPHLISLPIVCALIIYILVALIFTYKYSIALSAEEAYHDSSELEKEMIQAEVEKARLKVKKKRLKAETKAKKKESKRD